MSVSVKYMRDYSDINGARLLARMIESYWAERGYKAHVDFREVGYNPVMRERRFELRSNLKNGLPHAQS